MDLEYEDDEDEDEDEELSPRDRESFMRAAAAWQVSAVIQPMTYLPDNPTLPNQPKGIKVVLTECGLWQPSLQGKCKKCTSDACCGRQILELQPDFQEQKSLV
jgi:hypothetical protein